MHAYSHSNPTKAPQNIPRQQSRPKQESVNMNSFWSPAGTQSTSGNAGKFDAFSSFFPTSNQPAKKQNTVSPDIYDEFFSEKPAKPNPPSKTQNSNQMNLLDL
jgi:hypothetical protein